MSRWRRIVFAFTAAVTLLVALFSNARAQTLRPAPREAMLQRAADALARGDADAALREYEAAAAQEHAAEIEAGIVRSLMQGGHYRRALAFAAHTAQAHPGAPEGARLYAQLLDAGGHSALAARVRPADAAPAAKLAPALASGVLIDAGRHALLPLRDAIASEAATIELRDGHGRALAARVVQRDDTLGLALLRLDAAQADAPPLLWAAKDAFPGSPAHAIAATAGELPWPRLRSGFVGTRALGIDLAGGAAGGAVFDNTGRATGVSLAGDDGTPRLIPVSALRRWLGSLLGDAADAAPTPTALDAIYETALRSTVLLRSASP
jgi:S1-C subfamily serine protease